MQPENLRLFKASSRKRSCGYFRQAWAFLAATLCLAAASATATVSGTKTALVMLVSMADAPIDCTIAEVNGIVFTNTPLCVNTFYEHATWGSVHWAGAVINVSIAYSIGTCATDTWSDAADAAARLQGYEPNNYTTRVYSFPCAAGSCGYAWSVGNRVVTFHGSDLFAYGHEMGHSIGLGHAGTDHNNDGVIENAYGGNDDCMGGESYTFNAPHKIWGGWLPERPAANGGWRQITNNGTYMISPLEINPTNPVPYSQTLKIVPPTGNPYFLSYRQPLDFDQGWTATQVGKDGRTCTSNDPNPPISAYKYVNGVTIHRHSGGTGFETYEIGVLENNQQFAIPGTGITIKQTGHDSAKVTLSITGFNGSTPPYGITVYEDGDFGGAQSQVLPPGTYTLAQLNAKGVPNDWSSSCKIPNGLTMIMYQHDNFSGTAWTNTGNVADLSTLTPSGANNQMSSCKIIAGAAVAPMTPADLSAVGGNTQVMLSWTPSPGATGYHVKRSNINGGPYTTVATPSVSGFLNTGLTNGTPYYYVVTATNSTGSSAECPQVSATPTSDLVARWKFDENTGSLAADASGNGNTGTLLNTPTWFAPGKIGAAALTFAASSLESVTAASSSSLNSPTKAITLSAWIYAFDWNNNNRRIIQKGNSDNQYRLLAEDSLLKFHLSGVDTLTAPLPPVNKWVHIAATWNGTTMAIFTNGVQQASMTAFGTISATTDLLAIGKKNTSGYSGDYFNGRMDEVRIYNRALSGTEIVAIMTNLPPGFTSSPVIKPGATVGASYSETISTNATDPNGDAVSFAKISGPAWLGLSSAGILSGTPGSGDAGTNSFQVRASDSSLASTGTVQIVVNGAPIFTMDPFTKPSVVAGQAYTGSLSGDASDPNGDPLTFSKISGPAWLSVASNGGLSGTPVSLNIGTNSFVVGVTDSFLSNTATMSVTVTPAPATVLSIASQGTNLSLAWTGGIAPYQIQTRTNLGSGTWENVGGLVPSNTFGIPTSNAAAFYRIRSQ